MKTLNLFVFLLMTLIALPLAHAAIDMDVNSPSILQGTSEDIVITLTNTNNGLTEINLSTTDYLKGSESITFADMQTISLADGKSINLTLPISVSTQSAGVYWSNYTLSYNDTKKVSNQSLSVLEIDLSVPSSITFSGMIRGNTTAQTITVTNTGDVTLTNVKLNHTISTTFNPTVTPTNLGSIAAGASKTVTVALDVPQSTSTNKQTIGTIFFTSDQQNASTSVVMNPTGALAISDVTVRVDGSRSRDLSDGDTIREEARPGSIIDIEVEIENLFEDRDMEIEDIEVEILIEDIDSGDDIDLDASSFDLDGGRDETIDFSFTVPLLVEEDTYRILISVEGEDSEGNFHEVTWELFLDVEKERHHVIIERVSVSPSILTCSDRATVEVSLVNVGSSDEDVRVVVTNNALNLNVERETSLDEGDDRDARGTLSFPFNVDDKQKGIFTIGVDLYVDDTLEESETVTLDVRECGANQPTDPQEGTGGIIVQPTMPGGNVVSPPQQSFFEELRGSSAYLIALALLVIVLAGLVLWAIRI